MIEAVRNAWNLPDLRKRILVTVLILAIYRMAAHVPVPGVDREALAVLLSGQSAASNLVGILNMLSGGAVANFSVLAMGVYPYITASIIMQLLQPIIPALEELAKEGEAGRNKMNMYTYYLAIPMSALQAVGQIRLFSAGQLTGGYPIMPGFGFSGESLLPSVTTVITMTAGTMFAIWLGELITEQGIGNGLSIIIFGGIVSRVPQRVGSLLVGDVRGLIVFLIIMVVTVVVIVIVQEGQRRIPVQYGKRVLAMRGSRLRVAGGQSTHIPLRVNTAGMIPLIFAQAILAFPAVAAQFFVGSENAAVSQFAGKVTNFFGGQSPWYGPLFFLAVVGFTYFYTDMMVQQQDLPGALKRQGGFIPGIRPGKKTASYINSVYRRITLVGAVFLGGVAVLPYVVDLFLQTRVLLVTSSGLLIVVGVVLDTMRQLEAQLLMRHYEGFIK